MSSTTDELREILVEEFGFKPRDIVFRKLITILGRFIASEKATLLDEVQRRLPNGCEWCDYKGYTETGGMAMEDDLVEKQPCENCYDILDQVRSTLKDMKEGL